jgi:hypothetical protein
MGNLDFRANGVHVFRWLVFLLAAIYVLRQFWFTADYTPPGGPFKYLTHWALLLSLFSSIAMLALSFGQRHRDWGTLVAVTAVTNALVVMLYWRLWFTDPKLVNSNGPIVWYVEYYLHLSGPILQWVDALFVFGAFRRIVPALGALLTVIIGYVGWIELFVAPTNSSPVGSVTSGLPYPFLNSMVWDERLGFYLTTAVTGLIFLALFWGLSWAARKGFSRKV